MNPEHENDIRTAETDTAAALAAGAALNAPRVEFVKDITDRPVALVPAGIEVVDLSPHLPAPRRLKQQVWLHTAQAFGAYVNVFGDTEDTIILANQANETLTAYLDYHHPDSPSWLGHQAILKLKKTPEWVDWNNHSGAKGQMNQVDFAHFLEDHIQDIAEPNGAELLQIALTIEATKGISFKSHRRLTDGSVLAMYQEEVKGTAQDGKLQIPTSFTLGLVPFEGSSKYKLKARFRFRIADGNLVVWYELERPEDILRDAFTKTVEMVRVDTVLHARGVLLGALA